MERQVTINDIQQITHNVKQFRVDKPGGFSYVPGQATEVSIDKPDWRDKKRPFSPTSLNGEPYIEFIIKIYEDHEGVTNELNKLNIEDQLILRDPWGSIQYKGSGVFLAGGAGVTPFISILRRLAVEDEIEGDRLIFSNKTERDIILEDELEGMLGNDFINVITDEPTDDYIFLDGFIDKTFLEEQINDFDQPFYICGPLGFVDNMLTYLQELGADPDGLIFEDE